MYGVFDALLIAAVVGIAFVATIGPRRRRRIAAAEQFMRERAAKTQRREDARRLQREKRGS